MINGMMKATQEHITCENIVNRVFKTGISYNVLLTDITYLFYGNNKKCYLSTIKDSETNEILALHMKDELNLDTCFTFRDVCNEIKDYIEYYNNCRYQWNLKKMTPVQYRNHLFESIT